MTQFRGRAETITIGLILLLVIGYCLPWIMNPGTGLSLGGYDLAEWTSLHAEVRGSSPPLLISLLLRLPLCCLSIMIASLAFPNYAALRVILALVIAAALLPPLEFFTQAANDSNYRQQFILAGLTMTANLVLAFVRWGAIQKPLLLIIAIVGIVSSSAGLLQAHSLMSGFGLQAGLGWGGVVSIVAFGMIGWVVLQENSLKQTR